MASVPSASLTKWNQVSGVVFSGGYLVALETETVGVREPLASGRPGPLVFTYYSARAVRTRLVAGRTRFARPDFTTAVVVRTSIGTMSGSRIFAGGSSFVVVPGGLRFAPPVVWCCTAEDIEIVVESDGREGAAVPVAAGIDGARVRALTRDASGAGSLVSASPQLLPGPDDPDTSRMVTAFPGRPERGTSAIGPGVVAWADDPASGVLTLGVPNDTGVDTTRTVRLPGRILGVWADTGMALVLVRSGSVHRVMRVPVTGSPTVAWSGPRVPRVAIGRGTVAVGDGRAVHASRTGRVRRVATSRGPIAAVAADGDRIAWMERITRRTADGPVRRTVARLARVRR